MQHGSADRWGSTWCWPVPGAGLYLINVEVAVHGCSHAWAFDCTGQLHEASVWSKGQLAVCCFSMNNMLDVTGGGDVTPAVHMRHSCYAFTSVVAAAADIWQDYVSPNTSLCMA